MIEKERLEELIEKGATVYCPYFLYYDGVKLNKNTDTITDAGILIYRQIYKYESTHDFFKFDNLFETKEDSEEFAEFGNITRTERLELPSWEDVKRDSETLKNGTYTIAEHKYLFSLNLKILKFFPTQIVLFTDTEKYGWNLSRENYNEARRLCVKLFEGEEV